jgi:hypothetical protein
MTGRQLDESITRIGQERSIRKLALQIGASLKQVAEMPLLEVCDLVANEYEMLCVTKEGDIILYRQEDKEKVDSILKLIER